MQNLLVDQASSLFARMQRWLHLDALDDHMPPCPCDVATAASASAGESDPHASRDHDRIERAAIYAVGGYFHSGFPADAFVHFSDIWLDGDGKY
jgi:hypothetical protein